MSGHVEPAGFSSVGLGEHAQEEREGARKWRLTVPLDCYRNIRKRFEAAGLTIYLCRRREGTQFRGRLALGAKGFVASTTLSEARRLVPFFARQKMLMCMHKHNNLVDPDQFATPESFEKALAMAEFIKRYRR